MIWKYILPELIVALVAVGLLVARVAGVRLNAHASGLIAFVGLAGAGVALAPISGASIVGLGGAFILDPVASFFKYIFLVAGCLVIVGSLDFVDQRVRATTEFHVFMLFGTLGLMFMVSSGELLTLFLALEFSVICFFILTASSKDALSLEAALKYVVFGGFSAALMLYGMSLIYGLTGTTVLSQIGQSPAVRFWSPGLTLAGLLLLSGFGFKIAAVPFHFWAPDIYQGAPTPVTAYLSVASKAAGFAVLSRVFLTAFGTQSVRWGSILAGVAAITMVYGNLAAIPQTDFKRLLAYSSLAQSGYILLGVVAMTPAGVGGLLFYGLLYTLSNLTAFLCLLAFERETGSTSLASLAGLSKRSPGLAAALLISLLSLGGIPPLAGFIGKFLLFATVVQRGYIGLTLLAVLTSVASIYYYLGVAKIMYVDAPTDERPIRVTGWTGVSLAVALGGTILFGVYPQPLLLLTNLAARLFWG